MTEYSALKHPIQFPLLVLRKLWLINSDPVHSSSTGRFLRSGAGVVSHTQPPWWEQGWEQAEGNGKLQVPPGTVSRATARQLPAKFTCQCTGVT